MRGFVTYAFVITFLSSFLTILAVPTLVGAQNQSESSNNANVTGPHKLGVKITSPLKNATVPVGQLTIRGISSDSAITNCMVSVDWNDLKPMQNVTAKGPGGASDYSNWTSTYNRSYHNITAGINELTSKITCYNDPNNITKKYYTVNVTGS
jgi:hypothetical protein